MMDKVIEKFKNNELLNFDDLCIIGNYFIKNYNMVTNIIKNDEPKFNPNKKIVMLNDDTKSEWFLKEYFEFYDAKKINCLFNKEDIIKHNNMKQFKSNDLFNFILINSVAHEVRHYFQKELLSNKQDLNKQDYVVIKNLLNTKIMNSAVIYGKYHDSLYHEFDADINSALMVNEFNNNFIKSNTIEEFNQYACYKILRAYTDKEHNKISSPVLNTYEILPSIDKLMVSMKYVEDNYDSLKSIINSYNEYKYYEIFKYLNNNEEIVKKNFYDNLIVGNNLSIKELKKIKHIYLGTYKVKNLQKTLKK